MSPSDVAAGSTAGFVLGALAGAMFGNAGATYVEASQKGHNKSMLIGSFIGSVSLASAAAASTDTQQKLQARFP